MLLWRHCDNLEEWCLINETYSEIINVRINHEGKALVSEVSTVYAESWHRDIYIYIIVVIQNGCLCDVRDASFVCDLSQFLTAWRLVLSMKPWSYIWLEIGLFSTIIAIISACACWALFVVTLTNTVNFIYIYIYMFSSDQVQVLVDTKASLVV